MDATPLLCSLREMAEFVTHCCTTSYDFTDLAKTSCSHGGPQFILELGGVSEVQVAHRFSAAPEHGGHPRSVTTFL